VESSRIEATLRRLHSEDFDRVSKDLRPQSRVRRAMRPDLTTTKLLWGSTKHLGHCWKGFPRDLRTDVPGELIENSGSSMRVFLSHCHVDGAKAVGIARQMSAIGVSAWLAEIRIEYGGDIVEKVRMALHESDAIVGLVTRSFIGSLWCRTELETALRSAYP